MDYIIIYAYICLKESFGYLKIYFVNILLVFRCIVGVYFRTEKLCDLFETNFFISNTILYIWNGFNEVDSINRIKLTNLNLGVDLTHFPLVQHLYFQHRRRPEKSPSECSCRLLPEGI